MKPIVAIVGRPNVGKSTLFNRFAGERISIVEDTPGVTRDRVYVECEWLSRKFTLIDTGGLEPESEELIPQLALRQAEIAIEAADVIVLLVDAKTGLVEEDKQVANMLRRSKKPLVLAANKVDSFAKFALDAVEFYALGIGDPIPISAGQALGLGELLDAIAAGFPAEDEGDDDSDAVRVAVIGKPNVGKSSLINRILGEERVIVSDVPGTTRDAIDTPFERDGKKYIFIDTAGIRRRSKIYDNIEKYSIVRAVSAVERADVCVIIIDAEVGVTEQDTKIAGIAHESGKAAIFVVNKWDLIQKDDKTMNKYIKDLEHAFIFMSYAPKHFISALTGQRIPQLLDLIDMVSENAALRVSTGVLNDVLIEAVSMHEPPQDKGRALRLFYATQVSVKPPTFVIFVNDAALFHFSYKRYIENQFRQAFGFRGTPIRIIARSKEKS